MTVMKVIHKHSLGPTCHPGNKSTFFARSGSGFDTVPSETAYLNPLNIKDLVVKLIGLLIIRLLIDNVK